MATTAAGTPYVEASDLVAGYPAVSLALANHIDGLDGGKVLQVVQGTLSGIVATSSSSYSDTGLTATITPTSATSTVLVMVIHNGVSKQNNTGVNFKLLRGATDLGVFQSAAAYTNNANQNHVGSAAHNHLDSPATTSATTYKTQFASGNNIANAWIHNSGGTSSITLMEVSA